mgnify:CR=1 FL=1
MNYDKEVLQAFLEKQLQLFPEKVAETEEEAAEYFVTLDKTQLVEGEYQLNGMGAAVVAEMVKQSLLKHPYKKLRKLVKK